MRYCLNYLVEGFCPLKIEITQFPDGLRLNFTSFSMVSSPRSYSFTSATVRIGVNTAPKYDTIIKQNGSLLMWLWTLGLSNSAMNFLIYSANIRDFKEAYVDIFRKMLRL